jgi:beta-xylosidase
MKNLVFILLTFSSLNLGAQEYPKVILAGDYPDPTIIRDGKDFYMTHSTFIYKPGFLIWHSQDLFNWEPVCRVPGFGMAPDMVKYKDKYYIYFPGEGSNYVTWADHIMGTWSKPIDLKVGGIDPGHIVGEDGKRYLYLDKGEVIELSDDGLSTVGEKKKVYAGWQYPKDWNVECFCLESPKLNYKDGYFYMTSAEGGTAGPATSHMVVSARSRNVLGPWENSPYNPVVHTYSENDNWWSKGHGTLIDDAAGNWWIVYHAYANGFHTLGRQTLIEPVEWTKDGWYRTKPQASVEAQLDASLHHRQSDDFSSEKLGLQWAFWREDDTKNTVIKQNILYLRGKENGNILLTVATDKTYETQVEVIVGKNNVAGLYLFYNEKAFAGISSDGKQFFIYKDAADVVQKENIFGNHFFLKIKNQANSCVFFASKDGKTWETLTENVDVSAMNHNRYGGFFALRVGLLSAGKGEAQFKDFRYKNAVPTEADMSAYLMVFHQDDTHGLHMALSADGYSFTALNNGNPIIVGDTIADQKGIRDPHIFRGPDGAFYLVMTDLHIYGQQAGYRATAWERNKDTYGWGNNRGLVLMKSWNLINWTRANIRFDELSAQFAEVGCVWAPETTYDDETGKLMLYFTMRYRNEDCKMYYSYVNEDFNRLETLPRLLIEYSGIDADITKVDGKYHLFYVGNDGTSGIRQAVSNKINGDYSFDPRFYDTEPHSCEAPNVWKRINEDKWVLMYDIYGIKPHNFGFCETSDFVNFTPLGRFNEGVMKTTNFTSPKHGAVVHITKKEFERLRQYWNFNTEETLTDAIIHQETRF